MKVSIEWFLGRLDDIISLSWTEVEIFDGKMTPRITDVQSRFLTLS